MVAATLELVDAGNPVPTFADIAEASGVSERTIFRYFPDRDALFGAVATEVFPRIAHCLVITPPDGDLPTRAARPGRPPGRARRPHRPAHPLGRAPRPQQPARGRPARPAHRPAPGAGAPVVRARAGRRPAPAPPPLVDVLLGDGLDHPPARAARRRPRSSPSSPPRSCACSPPPEPPAPQNADSITSTSLPITHGDVEAHARPGRTSCSSSQRMAEAAQAQLLGAGDGLGRGAVGVRAAGLDLAEHERARRGPARGRSRPRGSASCGRRTW